MHGAELDGRQQLHEDVLDDIDAVGLDQPGGADDVEVSGSCPSDVLDVGLLGLMNLTCVLTHIIIIIIITRSLLSGGVLGGGV